MTAKRAGWPTERTGEGLSPSSARDDVWPSGQLLTLRTDWQVEG